MLRHTPEDEEIGEDVDDTRRLALPVDPDRQAFSRELIHHIQHAILPSIMGAILHEVAGPDMVGPFRTETDAGAAARPDPTALWLPGRDLQTLLTRDPLHPLVVDHPARGATQEGRLLPVAEPAMLADKRNQIIRQLLLVIPAPRGLALCRPASVERRTVPAHQDRQSLPDVHDARPVLRGTQ